MTRKHFEAMADMLREAKVSAKARAEMAKAMVAMFEQMNPRFNEKIFMDRVNR
jgi:hypothetical protein